MQGAGDVVAGYPQNQIEQEHCPSDDSEQPVQLFVVAVGDDVVVVQAEVDLDTLTRCIDGIEDRNGLGLAQPGEGISGDIVEPGHYRDIHIGCLCVPGQQIPGATSESVVVRVGRVISIHLEVWLASSPVNHPRREVHDKIVL